MQQKDSDMQEIWEDWAASLERWGLGNMVAHLLESAGALNVFIAQLIYFSQPFMNSLLPSGHLRRIANVLEDKDQTKAFTAYLLKGERS